MYRKISIMQKIRDALIPFWTVKKVYTVRISLDGSLTHSDLSGLFGDSNLVGKNFYFYHQIALIGLSGSASRRTKIIRFFGRFKIKQVSRKCFINVPLVLLDQWNWDQTVQIFCFTRVQLFLLFSGRIIGITLLLQKFLEFMGVKRFQGTIYSELFLFPSTPLPSGDICHAKKRNRKKWNRNQTGAWGSCIHNTCSYWIFLFVIIQY